MRIRWITRPLLAIVALVALLVTLSGILELTDAIQTAVGQASVEARLVAGSVQREMETLASERQDASIAELSADPRLAAALMDGLVLAPSVLHVSVIDPDGVNVAHTQPDLVGVIDPPRPTLPETRTFGQRLRALWAISRSPRSYQTQATLERGDRPFGTIRVVIAGTFLWEAVKQAASRGVQVAVAALALAVVAGVLLTRLATGRIQLLEAGVAAIREGRFEERLPESGIDEFGRLAHELNLLGAEFERRWRTSDEEGSPASAATTLDPTRLFLLDQSRVLSGLGQTAAGVTHELRNRLQIAQTDLEILRGADRLPPEVIQQHAESASRAVGSLGGVIRGFLKIAGVRPLAPRPVQINDLLRAIAREHRDEALLGGVELILELDPEMPETLADPEVLSQAVQNLIRNSLQALASREGAIRLRSGRGDGNLRIVIADDGPGIPPELLEKVFGYYFTTRPDGSGVGLALVRQSAQMHGGDVRIDSTPGHGTEVTFEIPHRANVPPAED